MSHPLTHRQLLQRASPGRRAFCTLVALNATCVTCTAYATIAYQQPVPSAPAAPNTQPQHQTTKQSVRLYHITFTGDLDTMRVARDLAEQLAKAQASLNAVNQGNAAIAPQGLIVLELGSKRWRADVVGRVIESVKDCHVPIYAILNEPRRRRVGLGALAIGLACDKLYIDSQTLYESLPADDAIDLAPRGSDATILHQRLIEQLRPAVLRRSDDPLIIEALLTPKNSLWLAGVEAEKRRLTPVSPPVRTQGDRRDAREPPSESSTRAVQIVSANPSAGGHRVIMSSAVLVEVGVAAAVVDSVGKLLVAEHLVATQTTRAEVTSEFTKASARVRTSIRAIDAGLDSAEGTFKKPPATAAKSESESDRLARVSRQVKEVLSLARQELEAIDADLLEYPELLQTLPPGETESTTALDKRESHWRSMLMKRRDRVEKIMSKVRQLTPK